MGQNQQYIQDCTIQEANQIEREMQNAVSLIVTISTQYEDMSVLWPDKSTEWRLEFLTNNTLFDRVAYVSADGTETSLEGMADVSDREYFKKGMSGESGWEAVSESRITGRSTTVFYAPILKNNKITGVMLGCYEQETMDALLSFEMFNFQPNIYLMQGDGTVVSSTKDEWISENMLDRLSAKNFIRDTDYAMIQEMIADKERTTVSFSFVENKKTTVGVIAQFKNYDWMILSVLPYDATEQMITRANRVGMVLLILIVLAFLFMVFMLVIGFWNESNRYESEMSRAVDSLETTMELEQYQYAVISSLANIYSCVCLVNLEDESYQLINAKDTSVSEIPEQGKWEHAISAYIDRFVDEPYREEMKKFVSLEHYKKTHKKHTVNVLEFQRFDKEWRRISLVDVEQKDGSVISCVFAVQKIDKEKKKELEAKKALEDAYEAARVANDAKTVFLSNMSHDIRTPMNAIIGMTAIAAANLKNENKVSDCLKKITTSSKHLLGLINEVLDMSKIESGKVDLCEEEFTISDLIDKLVSLNKPLVDEKKHTLIVTINNVLHEKVLGDSSRLQQVLTNLLSNAIKYTPNGGRIEISVTEKQTNKNTVGWYEIVFKDTGIGISEEFQKNLFEPFTRAKDNRITGIQGTGLGMPIARNIIQMMNGNITVESELDKGSTFTVSFALKL